MGDREQRGGRRERHQKPIEQPEGEGTIQAQPTKEKYQDIKVGESRKEGGGNVKGLLKVKVPRTTRDDRDSTLKALLNGVTLFSFLLYPSFLPSPLSCVLFSVH